MTDGLVQSVCCQIGRKIDIAIGWGVTLGGLELLHYILIHWNSIINLIITRGQLNRHSKNI